MKKTILAGLLIVLGYGTGVALEAHRAVEAKAAEVPTGHEAVEIGVCKRISPAPQLVGGRRYDVYECAEGRLIFNPIKEVI